MVSFRKVSAVITNAAIIGSLFLPIAVRADINSAVTYLQTKSVSPWITMALAAAGEAVDVNYLKTAPGSAVTDYETAVLALVAAGKDPRTFPNEDFVAKIKSFASGGQIGDSSTINDDIFGILALTAAGDSVSDPVLSGAKTFVLANQNDNGGWPFMAGGSSDTNMTAMAIMALLEVGVGSSGEIITSAVDYLRAAQNTDGGFPYDPVSPWGTDSDASSDAWVLSAIHKLGQSVASWDKEGNTPESHLWTLQQESGFFEYQTGTGEDAFSPVTTAYAVIALLGKSYPLRAGGISSSGGSGSTQGQVTVIHSVINDNGGVKTVSDFSAEVKMSGASVAVLPGASGYGATTVVSPGAFEVIEVAAEGYTITKSGECLGTVVAGQTVTCTITENDVEPAASEPEASLAPEGREPEVLGQTCEHYLPATSYIMRGQGEGFFDAIVKLQQFLNSKEGENLIVSGQYDSATVAAVKRFQMKYADRILKPWGISEPTGNVYITTTAMMNELADPDCASEPMPNLVPRAI